MSYNVRCSNRAICGALASLAEWGSPAAELGALYVTQAPALDELFSRVAERRFLCMVYPAIDIANLTVGERLGLIEQVWDSLRRDAGDLTLNESERVLIEARRAEHRADPDSTVGWDAVRAELLNDQDADDRQNSSAPRG